MTNVIETQKLIDNNKRALIKYVAEVIYAAHDMFQISKFNLPV